MNTQARTFKAQIRDCNRVLVKGSPESTHKHRPITPRPSNRIIPCWLPSDTTGSKPVAVVPQRGGYLCSTTHPTSNHPHKPNTPKTHPQKQKNTQNPHITSPKQLNQTLQNSDIREAGGRGVGTSAGLAFIESFIEPPRGIPH